MSKTLRFCAALMLPALVVLSGCATTGKAGDGTILLAGNGDDEERNVVRLVDTNRDGDYLDNGETHVVASAALGVAELARPRAVQDLRDPSASDLPVVQVGDAAKNVLAAADGVDAKLYGLGGADRLNGADGDDGLFGGPGRDALFGDDGDDVLDGGRDADMLFGCGGADLFVLADGDAPDVIRDFSVAEGDAVLIRIAALLDDSGKLDVDQLRLTDRGSAQVLEADLDAGDGFQPTALATVFGDQPLTLADLLL
jgi:Ca2+-binding RTX toxin-like protein